MHRLVYDAYLPEEVVRAEGAVPVSLETPLQESDLVCIWVPLSDQTRGLLGARQFGIMKRTAFLINAARGPIVDERALTQALIEGRIQGAGLDVFEEEPVPIGDPLLALGNLILTPHALGSTDEKFRSYRAERDAKHRRGRAR